MQLVCKGSVKKSANRGQYDILLITVESHSFFNLENLSTNDYSNCIL